MGLGGSQLRTTRLNEIVEMVNDRGEVAPSEVMDAYTMRHNRDTVRGWIRDLVDAGQLRREETDDGEVLVPGDE